MSVEIRRRGVALVATTAAVALVAGCASGGGASSAGSSSAPTGAGVSLGTPNPASGTPVVFGVLSLESGPVTFPEVLLAEQAAVEYVNEYKGGIGGHPIELVTCVTDGQPSTSQRCANQIADQKPVAILGAADTGSPGAVPVWERAGLAYLGGVSFTPVEASYADAVIFSSVATGDNAAASVYAAQGLGAKSAAVIYSSDPQGTSSGDLIVKTMNNVGIADVTRVALPPTSSDVSSAVATAMGAKPDVIYINTPAPCPNILNTLKQLGNTAKVIGIDPCTSPKAVVGANGGADGMYFAAPVEDSQAGTEDSGLYLAALKKYAPADIALDSLAAIGFQTVVNVQAALADSAPGDLTTAKILEAFRTGSPVHNFMGHDYQCDGQQLAGAPAVCNAYQQIRQVAGTGVVVASPDYITAGSFYTP